MFLYELAEGETRRFTDNSRVAIGTLTPCDAERVQITFASGDSIREENGGRAAEEHEVELDRAKRTAGEKAAKNSPRQ